MRRTEDQHHWHFFSAGVGWPRPAFPLCRLVRAGFPLVLRAANITGVAKPTTAKRPMTLPAFQEWQNWDELGLWSWLVRDEDSLSWRRMLDAEQVLLETKVQKWYKSWSILDQSLKLEAAASSRKTVSYCCHARLRKFFFFFWCLYYE